MISIDVDLTDDYDIQIDSDGDIKTADFFDTALAMSLLCERRADPSEVPQAERRRGWVGNESTPGFEIGSKLWLYEQSRVTKTTLRGIETVALNGLNWLIDDRYAISIAVVAGLQSGNITVTVDIQRPGEAVSRRFYTLWDNTG